MRLDFHQIWRLVGDGHYSPRRVETKIFVFVFSRKCRKNLFSLFAKKAYKKLRKFSRKVSFRESFRENFRFHESIRKHFRFRENFLFGMRIRIQEPPKCLSRSETLVENHPGNKIFRENFRKTKNFAKTFTKTKIFAKRNFAKSDWIFAYFRFSRKWKKWFSFQPYRQVHRYLISSRERALSHCVNQLRPSHGASSLVVEPQTLWSVLSMENLDTYAIQT
jgi:hypothetical protein